MSDLTQRERYIRVLSFQAVDRAPLMEWPIRSSTLDKWKAEGLTGLPEELAQLDSHGAGVPISAGMHPAFDENIIEETGEYKVWVDSSGAVRKDFKDQATPGFVTRSWLKFPVETRADLPRFRKKYDPSTSGRYPADWSEQVSKLQSSAVPVLWDILGPFWVVRQWIGFEGTCIAFRDDPALIEEMIDISMNCILEAARPGLQQVKVDRVIINEDMAYKTASMISPEMVRKFLLPHYRRLNDFFRANGVKVVIVDSDGHCGELIPIWLDAGFDGFTPVEIAAGNDPVAIRRQYPGQVAMMGGIDKRELSKDRQAIYNEVMRKVPYLIEQGGYIPHVDHAVPPDISLSNFLYYRELLRDISLNKPVAEPSTAS